MVKPVGMKQAACASGDAVAELCQLKLVAGFTSAAACCNIVLPVVYCNRRHAAVLLASRLYYSRLPA